MQAGRGMWHGGGLDKAGRTRGFQLWIALPPEHELGPTISICQTPEALYESTIGRNTEWVQWSVDCRLWGMRLKWTAVLRPNLRPKRGLERAPRS